MVSLIWGFLPSIHIFVKHPMRSLMFIGEILLDQEALYSDWRHLGLIIIKPNSLAWLCVFGCRMMICCVAQNTVTQGDNCKLRNAPKLIFLID